MSWVALVVDYVYYVASNWKESREADGTVAPLDPNERGELGIQSTNEGCESSERQRIAVVGEIWENLQICGGRLCLLSFIWMNVSDLDLEKD